MGDKYEVVSWKRPDGSNEFKDVHIKFTSWFIMALLTAWLEKRKDVGCVSILWR